VLGSLSPVNILTCSYNECLSLSLSYAGIVEPLYSRLRWPSLLYCAAGVDETTRQASIAGRGEAERPGRHVADRLQDAAVQDEGRPACQTRQG